MVPKASVEGKLRIPQLYNLYRPYRAFISFGVTSNNTDFSQLKKIILSIQPLTTYPYTFGRVSF